MPAPRHTRMTPRKQPRQERAQATCEAVLEAAAQLLEEEGARATTNRIADRAGVSIGSLYQYFPTKQAIWSELVRRMHAQMLADLEETVTRSRDLPLDKAVGALLETSVRHHFDRPDRMRALEHIEHSLPPTEAISAIKAGIEPLVAGVLARQGVPDPLTAARDLSVVTGAMVDAAIMAGETDPAPVMIRLDRMIRGYLTLG